MRLVWLIAWRNILRHKGKSLVIGVILFLGAFLMTLGNGVITGMDLGLRENIINGFLGDLVVVSEKQKSDNVLFEVMGKAVEPIHNFLELEKVLANESFVERYLPVGKNMAMALNDDTEPGWVYLLGVDFCEYQKMFPDNMILKEGRLISGSERGVLVPVFARKEFYNYCNVWLIPEGGEVLPESFPEEEVPLDLNSKSSVVFMGYNNENSTTDIRLGVKGVIEYKALNTFWGHFMLMDIESYRECLGYFAASDKVVEVPKKQKELLEMDDEGYDALFEEDLFVVDNEASDDVPDFKVEKREREVLVNLKSGAYNMVLIKLKDHETLKEAKKVLNERFLDFGLGARVITWKQASGIVGSLSGVIKGFLFGFVMFLFFVAIIIIVNTLSMAALERASEIGMMRAVGAQRCFIRNMFLGETAILSFVFGGVGIVLGVLVVWVLPFFSISTDNDMLQLLYGGDVLRPKLFFSDICLTVFQLVLVTFIAVLYPVRVASKITPLDAISRD